MATSQFTIYSSSDVNGPGPLFGATGSLNKVLEYCLISGSVSKVAAGWSHPIANSSSAAGDSTVYAAYRPASGSRMTLFVNDNATNVSATSTEAMLTGWENMTSLCPAVAYNVNVGGGTGQFPTPAQALTTGHVACRKSVTADTTTQRYWVAFADAYTMYLCIQPGDAENTYNCIAFGDIFSFAGAADAYRCLLIGRGTENAAGGYNVIYSGTTVVGYDNFAASVGYFISNGGLPEGYTYIPLTGHYMPRTSGGGGTSINVGKTFDFSKGVTSGYSGASNSYGLIPMYGFLQTPNGADNSLYLSPVTIHEPSSRGLRGRMRGFWFVAHSSANFADGQTFAGGGDYAGKSFMIVKTDCTGGFFAMETSNTVETN